MKLQVDTFWLALAVFIFCGSSLAAIQERFDVAAYLAAVSCWTLLVQATK